MLTTTVNSSKSGLIRIAFDRGRSLCFDITTADTPAGACYPTAINRRRKHGFHTCKRHDYVLAKLPLRYCPTPDDATKPGRLLCCETTRNAQWLCKTGESTLECFSASTQLDGSDTSCFCCFSFVHRLFMFLLCRVFATVLFSVEIFLHFSFRFEQRRCP